MIKQNKILYLQAWTWFALFSGPFGHAQAQEEEYTIFVARDGWHTGIILKTADVPIDLWPEIALYREHNYVDIGWGNERFFTEPEAGVYLALRAVLIPTQSVALVRRYNLHPDRIYGKTAQLFKTTLTEKNFNNLCRFISDSFLRDDEGHATPQGTPNFFLTKRNYHLFRTCNTWAASALNKAGVNICPFPVITGDQLVYRLEKLESMERLE